MRGAWLLALAVLLAGCVVGKAQLPERGADGRLTCDPSGAGQGPIFSTYTDGEVRMLLVAVGDEWTGEKWEDDRPVPWTVGNWNGGWKSKGMVWDARVGEVVVQPWGMAYIQPRDDWGDIEMSDLETLRDRVASIFGLQGVPGEIEHHVPNRVGTALVAKDGGLLGTLWRLDLTTGVITQADEARFRKDGETAQYGLQVDLRIWPESDTPLLTVDETRAKADAFFACELQRAPPPRAGTLGSASAGNIELENGRLVRVAYASFEESSQDWDCSNPSGFDYHGRARIDAITGAVVAGGITGGMRYGVCYVE